MQLRLKNKIDNTLISARALYAAELAGDGVLINVERADARLVWDRQAMIGQGYVQRTTGKGYGAVKMWIARGYLRPIKTLGTAPLFDVGQVEHLLQTETFAMSDDELCEAAWIARAFWAWVPRDGLEAAPDSPAERISKMPFIHDIYALVDGRLAEVAVLHQAAGKQAVKQAEAAIPVKPKKSKQA